MPLIIIVIFVTIIIAGKSAGPLPCNKVDRNQVKFVWFSYLFAGLCGIAFGLLQARWTGKMVHAGENHRRMLGMTVLKLLSWLLVMTAFALYNITALIVFVLCAGFGMVGLSIYLWRKSLKETRPQAPEITNHQEVAH